MTGITLSTMFAPCLTKNHNNMETVIEFINVFGEFNEVKFDGQMASLYRDGNYVTSYPQINSIELANSFAINKALTEGCALN